MTVASTTNPARNNYTGNGSTTVYNFTFPVLKESNRADNKEYSIKVIITENETDTVKTETTDYTVTLNEDTRLGTITFGTAPTATQKITFVSDVDVSQATDYNNIGTGAFPADSHEKALDKLTILFRQFLEKENRAISLPESSSLSNLEIPVSSDNADKAIVINSTGDNLEAKNLADIGTAPVTDFAKTLLDDTTNTQARTTLDVYSKSEAEQKANSLTEKSSVVVNDKFIIADSQDSNNSKKASLPNASETQKGIVERATQAEVDAGTDAERFITSTTLKNNFYPTFKATMSAQQTVSNGVTTKIVFDTEEWDSNSNYDISNYRFTPQKAGTYFVSASIDLVDAGQAPQGGSIEIRKNNALISITTSRFYDNGSEGLMTHSLIQMNGSSDYLEAFGYIGGSGANKFHNGSGSCFQAFRITNT